MITDKQTLSKSQLMEYLGISEYTFKNLTENDPNFPKPKPYLKRWSRMEIDYWLNPEFFPKPTTGEDIKEYVNW